MYYTGLQVKLKTKQALWTCYPAGILPSLKFS